MCTVLGIQGTKVKRSEVLSHFETTTSRGPDGTVLQQVGDCWLGFQRLAIMDLSDAGMQPFSLDGDYVVCNGEIYGFRSCKEALKKTYTFTSDSDCEIILPLYREYGVEMFSLLGSEFALVLYDGTAGELMAARDPIGIRPLYYGYDAYGEICFASEAKILVGLCERIKPFPPGHYYKDGAFHRYMSLTEVSSYTKEDLDTVCAQIRRLLIQAVEQKLDADAPLGFLLSGGLDSSLVCAIASKILGRKIRTFAIGMDTDPIDLKYAQEAADFMGAEHTSFTMTKEEVLAAVPEVIQILGTWDITTIRASIGMYLCCKKIHETTDIRVLMTGEISDELFGYKYTDYAPDPESFQRESAKRIDEIHQYDVLRADRCIASNSLEGRVPFGETAFVKYVMGLDPAMKMNTYGMGKYLLRHAFEEDGLLPEDILWRQKAAFSDAVGHSMVDDLKEYAESLYSNQDFVEGCQKYDYATPFTKESLWYRDLFEQFYPGQAEMIADYWMPNREWEHCDVQDPSARVLENYGASGF